MIKQVIVFVKINDKLIWNEIMSLKKKWYYFQTIFSNYNTFFNSSLAMHETVPALKSNYLYQPKEAKNVQNLLNF